MTLPAESPALPDPTSGLADPRPSNHSPEILGNGPDAPSEDVPDEAMAGEPPGQETAGAPEAGTQGLVDPRGEIPGPSAP